MDPIKKAKKLSKFLTYVLGHHPDEFGIVPDPDGFVKVKTLLKALNEEEGWRHVRAGSLNEAQITISDPGFELQDKLIRAIDRTSIPSPRYAEQPPKLLYICVRQKAYPHVSDKGITATAGPHLVLAQEKEMALRIGKRSDAEPVLLTINTDQAESVGIVFHQFGDGLFLTDSIPRGCFSGPPLPKEKPEPAKKTKPEPEPAPKTPGSFFVDFIEDPEKKKRTKRERMKKEIAWKKDRKRSKRQKW